MTPKDRKAAVTLIRHAYSALEPLNNIKWTSYRDTCFDMALAEEKQHRGVQRDGWQWGITTADAARLFVCKRIAESMRQQRHTIADVLSTQPSAIYAASIVANHAEVIRKALTPQTLDALRELNYAALVDVSEHEHV